MSGVEPGSSKTILVVGEGSSTYVVVSTCTKVVSAFEMTVSVWVWTRVMASVTVEVSKEVVVG